MLSIQIAFGILLAFWLIDMWPLLMLAGIGLAAIVAWQSLSAPAQSYILFASEALFLAVAGIHTVWRWNTRSKAHLVSGHPSLVAQCRFCYLIGRHAQYHKQPVASCPSCQEGRP